MADDWFTQNTRAAPSSGGVVRRVDPFRVSAEKRAEQDQGFEERRLGFDERRLASTEAAEARQREDAEKGRSERRFTNISKLRDDFKALPEVKSYNVAIQQMDQAYRTGDGPQGDLALTYAFAKAMDPDSVVRDAEQSMQTNSQPWFQAAVESAKKQFGMDGAGVFTPAARQALRDQIASSVASRRQLYDNSRNYYTDLAKRYEFDPYEVVGRDVGQSFLERFKGYGGNAPAAAGGVVAAGTDDRVIDPMGGNSPMSSQDRAFLSKNARMLGIQGVRDYVAARGLKIPESELKAAFDQWAKGDTQDATVNPPQGDPSLWGQIASSAPGQLATGYLNGAMIGGLDEVGGGIDALIRGVPISQGIEEANQKKQAVAAESPWLYGTGNIAGGLTSAALGGVLGLGSKAPVLTDVGIGGLTGVLEDNDNRLRGGAVGGILGGTIGSVFRGVSGLRNRPTGTDLPFARSLEKAGPEDVLARMDQAAALGVPMSPADADPVLTALAGSATRMSPNAERMAGNAFIPRQRGQIDRFDQAIERDLGSLINPMEQSAALAQQAKDDAAPLYEIAHSMPVVGTPGIDEILATPFGKQALSKARTIAANDRRSPDAMGLRLDADGNVVLEPTVPMTLTSAGVPGGGAKTQRGYTMRALDQTKQGMDDIIEQYRDKVTGRLNLTPAQSAENRVRADFLNELDAVNPAYAEARAAYGGPMQLNDALAAGKDAVRYDPRVVEALMGRMSPAEQAQARLGYRVKLSDSANDVQRARNPFESTLGPTSAEKRLKAMYPNEPGVARLLAQRDMERELSASTSDILANSATQKRRMADESFMSSIPGEFMEAGADALSGRVPVGSVARTLTAAALKDRVRMGTLRNAEQRADELAPILFNTDTPAAVDQIAEILARTQEYRDAQRFWQPIAGNSGAVTGAMIPQLLLSGQAGN